MNGKVKQFADASLGKISALEKRLSGVLTPVKPRQEFVNGIAQRIRSVPSASVLVERISNWRAVAVVVAGVLSVALFLALLGRALASLLGKKPSA